MIDNTFAYSVYPPGSPSESMNPDFPSHNLSQYRPEAPPSQLFLNYHSHSQNAACATPYPHYLRPNPDTVGMPNAFLSAPSSPYRRVAAMSSALGGPYGSDSQFSQPMSHSFNRRTDPDAAQMRLREQQRRHVAQCEWAADSVNFWEARAMSTTSSVERPERLRSRSTRSARESPFERVTDREAEGNELAYENRMQAAPLRPFAAYERAFPSDAGDLYTSDEILETASQASSASTINSIYNRSSRPPAMQQQMSNYIPPAYPFRTLNPDIEMESANVGPVPAPAPGTQFWFQQEPVHAMHTMQVAYPPPTRPPAGHLRPAPVAQAALARFRDFGPHRALEVYPMEATHSGLSLPRFCSHCSVCNETRARALGLSQQHGAPMREEPLGAIHSGPVMPLSHQSQLAFGSLQVNQQLFHSSSSSPHATQAFLCPKLAAAPQPQCAHCAAPLSSEQNSGSSNSMGYRSMSRSFSAARHQYSPFQPVEQSSALLLRQQQQPKKRAHSKRFRPSNVSPDTSDLNRCPSDSSDLIGNVKNLSELIDESVGEAVEEEMQRAALVRLCGMNASLQCARPRSATINAAPSKASASGVPPLLKQPSAPAGAMAPPRPPAAPVARPRKPLVNDTTQTSLSYHSDAESQVLSISNYDPASRSASCSESEPEQEEPFEESLRGQRCGTRHIARDTLATGGADPEAHSFQQHSLPAIELQTSNQIDASATRSPAASAISPASTNATHRSTPITSADYRPPARRHVPRSSELSRPRSISTPLAQTVARVPRLWNYRAVQSVVGNESERCTQAVLCFHPRPRLLLRLRSEQTLRRTASFCASVTKCETRVHSDVLDFRKRKLGLNLSVLRPPMEAPNVQQKDANGEAEASAAAAASEVIEQSRKVSQASRASGTQSIAQSQSHSTNADANEGVFDEEISSEGSEGEQPTGPVHYIFREPTEEEMEEEREQRLRSRAATVGSSGHTGQESPAHTKQRDHSVVGLRMSIPLHLLEESHFDTASIGSSRRHQNLGTPRGVGTPSSSTPGTPNMPGGMPGPASGLGGLPRGPTLTPTTGNEVDPRKKYSPSGLVFRYMSSNESSATTSKPVAATSFISTSTAATGSRKQPVLPTNSQPQQQPQKGGGGIFGFSTSPFKQLSSLFRGSTATLSSLFGSETYSTPPPKAALLPRKSQSRGSTVAHQNRRASKQPPNEHERSTSPARAAANEDESADSANAGITSQARSSSLFGLYSSEAAIERRLSKSLKTGVQSETGSRTSLDRDSDGDPERGKDDISDREKIDVVDGEQEEQEGGSKNNSVRQTSCNRKCGDESFEEQPLAVSDQFLATEAGKSVDEKGVAGDFYFRRDENFVVNNTVVTEYGYNASSHNTYEYSNSAPANTTNTKGASRALIQPLQPPVVHSPDERGTPDQSGAIPTWEHDAGEPEGSNANQLEETDAEVCDKERGPWARNVLGAASDQIPVGTPDTDTDTNKQRNANVNPLISLPADAGDDEEIDDDDETGAVTAGAHGESANFGEDVDVSVFRVDPLPMRFRDFVR